MSVEPILKETKGQNLKKIIEIYLEKGYLDKAIRVFSAYEIKISKQYIKKNKNVDLIYQKGTISTEARKLTDKYMGFYMKKEKPKKVQNCC